MTTALLPSPLRLPSGQPKPVAELAGGPRGCLEELRGRRFSGRVTLQRAGDLAELLLREGRPLAATLCGRDEAAARAGQAALDELLGLPAADWSYQSEALEPALLAALAGLGAEPEVCNLSTVAGLRALLRDLAQRGEDGVLELGAEAASARHWARALLADGRLLGAYSDRAPTMAASLEPLGGLLTQPLPAVRWFPARPSPLTIPPAVAASDDARVGAVERRVIWLVSRFEGDWGRARQRSAAPVALQESLIRMLESLIELARRVEAHGADAEALAAALGEPFEPGPRTPAEIDPRLRDLGPARVCPILVGLVADALQRIILTFADPNLTECCRQAALALQTELRAVFPPLAEPIAGQGGEAS